MHYTNCSSLTCDDQFNRFAPAGIDIEVVECNATCCEGNLCNVPEGFDESEFTTATTISPRTTTTTPVPTTGATGKTHL